jgi:hypothetical protein
MVDSVFTHARVPGPTHSFNPCTRSLASGCFFDPCIRESGIHIPDHISESLVYIFWDKILKFFVADPDPVIFYPGSEINIPDRIRNAVSKVS